MQEELVFHGLVLNSASSRDFDKRLCVLTKEQGKITVWASGAKKPGSPLMAATRNFVFGAFSVTKGRAGYNLRSVKVNEYFEDIALDLVHACYGSYLLELAELVAQENLPAAELVNLIYLSLRAILKESIPNELVRRIYELRVLLLNGEYTELPPLEASDACCYAWQYVLEAPLAKLYTFTLTPGVLIEFSQNVDLVLRDALPYHFRSLDILKAL